ncbi:MAG: uroporphyrinogen decarboxylase [Candidatus Hydrogenedentota bacterium]|nr:MAG: uroporphyrinogen decarboxylase [Candidatus Hydrogenedentota bacterium]
MRTPGARLSFRERFLSACARRPVDRLPVWMMRQAGRCLPEYNRMRERFSFLEMVRNPELAEEVTLQPIRRFGFDAAILFSDILVVSEALGQSYEYCERRGIRMAFPIRSGRDVGRLSEGGFSKRTAYVRQALRGVRKALGNQRALLGFAGSPWTLAAFMISGGSRIEKPRILHFVKNQGEVFENLMEILTRAVTVHLKSQLEAGADAVQIFDSLAGLCPRGRYQDLSGRWIGRIVRRLPRRKPVIVFVRGYREGMRCLGGWKTAVIGVDHTRSLFRTARALPRTALQGNLDPAVLLCEPEAVRMKTRRIARYGELRPGFIFNLGHGVPPNASLENIAAVVETVRSVCPFRG